MLGRMAGRLEHLTLEGDRVLVRPVDPADAARAFELLSGKEEILRWLVWQGPANDSELELRFARWRTDSDDEEAETADDFNLAICDRETLELVGGISVRFRGHPGQGDLGYWIGRDSWGLGFATEAVRLVTWLCFHHLGASVLYGWVFVGNDASRKVLEKNGYVLTHTARGKIEKGGRVVDEWYLALSRWDWEHLEESFVPRTVELRPESLPGSGHGPR